MIIVSQDKKVILNFNNITELQTEERIKNMDGEKDIMIEAVGNLGNTFILAYYETEERAKEVLQEIASKYSSYLKLEGGPAILQGQMDIQPNIFNIPKVYEMPTE